MHLLIYPDGRLQCIYDELIDLSQLGPLAIQRASHVEPDQQGGWMADLSPVSGPHLGPFRTRSEALQAERDWLEARLVAGVLLHAS